MEKNQIISRVLDKTFKYSGLKYLYLKNKKGKNKCPILLYHSLNLQISGVLKDVFEEHIKYLSSNYKLITLKEALHKITHGHLDGKELVITFDDGYEDNASKAFPILNKYDASATFFITTGLIALQYLNQNMMNRKQIKMLHRNGMEIGSHTITHPNLTAISKDRLEMELKQSKSELEEIIGDEVTSFAYPTGFYNESVIDMCKNAGYNCGCTVFHDFYIELKKKYEIPRIVVFPYDSVLDIKAKIEGEHHWMNAVHKIYLAHMLKKYDIHPHGIQI